VNFTPAYRSVLTIAFFIFSFCICSQTDSLYNVAVRKADAAYEFKWMGYEKDAKALGKFEIAKQHYLKASQINPSASYPHERIKEIERIIKVEREKLLKRRFFAVSDSLFKAQNFGGALEYYKKSDSIFPSSFNKQRILLCDAVSKISRKDSAKIFLNAVLKGDELLEKYKNGLKREIEDVSLLTAAINQYKKAETVRNISEYIKLKLDQEDLYSGEPDEKLDKQYVKLIQEGDAQFKTKHYSTAKFIYEDALKIKPGEKYPAEKIKEIEKLVK
jgi:tetratricopeptide (TPR) repeat protein